MYSWAVEIATCRIGFQVPPCVVVLGQDDNLHGHFEKFGEYRRIKMYPVVLVTGKHRVVKDDEAGGFMLGAG